MWIVDRVILNSPGVREMLRSNAVRARLHAEASAIAARAGDGFAAKSSIGHSRALAMVYAETAAARYAEAKDRTLTRSMS